MNNQTYAEAVSQCLQDLRKACHNFIDVLRECWEEIKRYIGLAKGDSRDYARNGWCIPSRMVMFNQVSSRKPNMITARSNC